MNPAPYGFRIAGATTGDRRLIDWAAAFSGYAACDARAQVERESYLSAFTFGEDFRQHLQATGSTAGFKGSCCASCLSFDLDSADLDRARRDACRLAAAMVERYTVKEDELLIFFSGAKGFHIGLPTAIWGPAPCGSFHATARQFAEHWAGLASVTIDCGVYDRVRAFRAPNSRHPKTGLHKRRLTFDELMALSVDAIVDLAKAPAPFDIPAPRSRCDKAADDWRAAELAVQQRTQANACRRDANDRAPRLNRSTLEFIRDGATQGDRHRLLFSAAANLAELDCPPALAHALLSEAALDSGLAPKEVRRQIECGLARTETSLPPVEAPAPGIDPPPGATQHGGDARLRPCAPRDAKRWTWEGAPKWFDMASNPIAKGATPKGGGA